MRVLAAEVHGCVALTFIQRLEVRGRLQVYVGLAIHPTQRVVEVLPADVGQPITQVSERDETAGSPGEYDIGRPDL